ncbi:MAG: glycosyltransferase family 2 protein, partial [Pseudomonadota bacterium]
MRIHLHIGLEEVGAGRLQQVLADKRDQLLAKGVLFAQSPGNKNHTRLYMAVTDAAHIDPLRYNRGYITPEKQAVLRETVAADLAREVAQHTPDHLILSAAQLGGSLVTRSELEQLRKLLAPLSDDIRIVAHIDEPARLLARHYANQVMEGRGTPLSRELDLAGTGTWWADALADAPRI